MLHARERRLTEKDFFQAPLGRLFKILGVLFDEAFPIDETALTIEEIRNRFGMRISPQDELFATIIEAAKSQAMVKNAKWHSELVKRASERRKILDAMVDALGRLPTETDLRPMIVDLNKRVDKVFKERMRQMYGFNEAVQSVHDNPGSDFIETGLASFDSATGGFSRGELVVVAAGENVGKSALGLTIALHAARSGHGVLFANLEMDDKPLARRAVSILSGVPANSIRDNICNPEQEKLVSAAQKEIQSMKIQMISPDAIDLPGLIMEIGDAELADPELRLVVIDYCGLVKHPNSFMRPHEKAREIADAVKNVAKSKRLVIIGLAQLNREGKAASRPSKSHIADSDQWSRNADVVWVLNPKGDATSGQQEIELIVDKNRNGETFDMNCYLDLACSRFYEPEAESF